MAQTQPCTPRRRHRHQSIQDQAPKTVRNFVELALGQREWTHPETGARRRTLYDGTIFHRIIDNFMIQVEIRSARAGGPGYKFADEFHPSCNSTAHCSRWLTRPRHKHRSSSSPWRAPHLNRKAHHLRRGRRCRVAGYRRYRAGPDRQA